MKLEMSVLLCVSLMLHVGYCQVRVDEEVYAWLASNVTLECRADTQEEIKQITWEVQVNETFKTFLTYRKDTGPIFPMPYGRRVRFKGDGYKIGSIEILNVTLDDDGAFKCVFTTFPSGTIEGKIQLQVLVLPTVRQDLMTDVKTPCFNMVAECLASSAKPAAEIQWITHGINHTSKEDTTVHSNGTSSTRSQLYMMTTPELYGREVLCLVYQPMIPFERRQNISVDETLTNIQFPPQMVQIEVLKNDEEPMQLLCKSEANPRPEYNWKRGDKEESKLDMSHLTSATLNLPHEEDDGLYICETANALGVNRGYIYMYSSKSSYRCRLGILISTIVFVCVVILIACYVLKSRLLNNKEYIASISKKSSMENPCEEKSEREEETRSKTPAQSPVESTKTSELAEEKS